MTSRLSGPAALLAATYIWGAEAPNGLSGTFGESRDPAVVAPSTGAMSYGIPFQLPANRGNAQPGLSLHYESGARTGEAGVGWSLALPSIERTPLSGWPKYIDDGAAVNEDRFSYNGRALTFICVVGGTPACPINDRIGRMPSWANGYRHYRLQAEGSFERFFWNSGASRWIVQERGGNILEFGLALTRPDLQLASAYETDMPSGRTFRWYLAVQRDLHAGKNLVFYRWATDGNGTRKYLKDIFYAPPVESAAVAPLSAFAYHVELLWDNPPYRQKDSTFADRRPHYKRLRRIAISAKPWEPGTDRELVRAYTLTYYPERGEAVVQGQAPLWGRSSLRSVQLEGRCPGHSPNGQGTTLPPVKEINGHLLDPTTCFGQQAPVLPALTFEYAPAKLAFGAATYVPVGKPGTSEELVYTSSVAVFDMNRDGLPDVVEGWPTNFRKPHFKVEYNECRDGDYLVNAGADPQAHDPQLTCRPDDDEIFDLRSARALKAWVNRGVSGGVVELQHHCMDAGGVEPRTITYYQITGPKGYGSREPSLFTQFGAEAVGDWGNGALLWSLAGYHAFGFGHAVMHVDGTPSQPDEYDEQTYRKFCPESAMDPNHPAMRWLKTGDATWSKDSQNKDQPDYRHRNIVDIDGDGYGDLLTETITPGTDGIFERAAIRFTRKISDLDRVEFQHGPALFPFITLGGAAVTVTPTFAEYSTYADVNGDGIVDLITARAADHNGAPEVRLGDGRGGFGCDPGNDIACQIPGNGPGTGDWLGRAYLLLTPDRASIFDPKPWPVKADFRYQGGPVHFFQDVTGDGLADIIKYEPPVNENDLGQVRLWVNVDGRTFRCANTTDCVVATVNGVGLRKPRAGVPHRILITDIDGNGTQDFVMIEASGNMWTFSFLVVDPVPAAGPRSPIPGLLTRIRNGVGADTEVVYQTVQELDLAARSPNPESFNRRWTKHIPQVLPVVTRIVVRDTPGVGGTPLQEPYRVYRTRRFEYRDPAYDLWQRSFKGFHVVRSIMPSGEVRQTWFYFGACEAGPFVDAGCLIGSDGNNDGAGRSTYADKALVGAVARVDRFVPTSGRLLLPDKWLSTQTTTYDVDSNWIQPAGTRPDRPVVLGRVARVDTYLYDTNAQVSQVNFIERPTQPQRVPNQPTRVHLRDDIAYDSAGNLMVKKAFGRVNEVSTGAAPDDVITTTHLPQIGRCAANWACAATEVTTADVPPGATVNRPLRHAKFQYNANGDLIEVQARLFATSSVQAGLQRDPVHGVGAPPSAQTAPGWKVLRRYEVDEVGNVQATHAGPGANEACLVTTFDTRFRQFPETISRFAGSACTGTLLTEEMVYDRGLGAVVKESSSDRTVRTVERDPFGRTTRVNDPAADASAGMTQPSLEIIRHTQEPTRWVEVRRRVDQDQFVSTIDILNGVGEPVLGFDQADPVADGAPWVLRDWMERDNDGRTSAVFRPWFFSGDARNVANTAAVLAPQGSRSQTFRDAFGRPLIVFDGTLAVAEYAYMPLTTSAKDAERRKSAGAFTGLEAVAKQDGHGRTVETTVPSADDQTTTRTEYLGTGEVAAVRRSSDRDPAALYERRMHWDSFGRMIANAEPNTSGPDASGAFRSWRYVYDDEGRMVGTSDARGCGKNLYYDALGRIRAEDFSPCATGQAAYTVPDLVNGNGTEAFYRYDAYSADAISPTAAFANSAESAMGRVVSVQDLGANTRFSYDERGRIRRATRQIAKPGPPQASLANRYANHWFKQEVGFDVGDRLRTRTLGLEGTPFPADSSESFTYSSRGLLREVGSSFGGLVSEIRSSAAGLPLDMKYGDLAGTRTEVGYDTRNRVRRWRTSRATAPALWSAASTRSYSKPGSETTQLTLADLEFSYDDVGNVLSINDGSADTWPQGARPVSRAFQYDAGYHLTQVDYTHGADSQIPVFLAEALAADARPVAEQTSAQRVKHQSFSTDWQGNLTRSDDDVSLRFGRSLGPVLNGAGRDGEKRGPNQLVDADGIHAAYDAAGNLTDLTVARTACWDRMPKCSHRFRYEWDEAGQLAKARRWDYPAGAVPATWASAPAWEVNYEYSQGNRTRTSVTSNTGAASHTLDVFDTLRIVRASYQAATSSYRIVPENQIGSAGGVAKVFVDRARALPMAGTSPVHLYFNVRDYLGSSAFAIDKDSGEVVERTSHQPFGATEADYRPERWAGAREAFKFTGKEEDIEVGATYFGARYYNAKLGRWMSPDPLTIHGMGGDLNPYAYVSGRVMNLTDPLGLDPGPGNRADVVYYPNGGWSATNPDGTVEVGGPPDPEPAAGAVRQPISFERGEPMPSKGTQHWMQTPPQGEFYVTANDESSSAGGVPSVAAFRSTTTVYRSTMGELIAKAHPELAPRIHAAERQDIFLESAPMLLMIVPGGGPVSAATRGGPLAGRATTVLSGGTGRAIAGHGWLEIGAGRITVPPGTTVTTWTLDGTTILDSVGQMIEQGNYAAIPAAEVEGAYSALPGATLRNYTVGPPTNLTVMQNSRMVYQPTPLGQMVGPNMGHIDCAFCLE